MYTQFVGKNVMVICNSYFYSGTLKMESSLTNTIELIDGKIVLETGPLDDLIFKNAEPIEGSIVIGRDSIESIFLSKKK
jgi:hypothetical protein